MAKLHVSSWGLEIFARKPQSPNPHCRRCLQLFLQAADDLVMNSTCEVSSLPTQNQEDADCCTRELPPVQNGALRQHIDKVRFFVPLSCFVGHWRAAPFQSVHAVHKNTYRCVKNTGLSPAFETRLYCIALKLISVLVVWFFIGVRTPENEQF